jgi:MSHA biogenesis protein MshN
MSVINQVLLDLEKRRASSAERGAVPNHVRALPDDVQPMHWAWVAGGAAAVVVAAAAWMLLAGSSATRSSPPSRTGAEVVIEKVVAASAGVTSSSQPGDDVAAGPAPAFRLSFELSNIPDEAEVQREAPAPGKRGVSAPVPTARVIGRVDPEPMAQDAPPAAKPRTRPERAANDRSAVATGAAEDQPGIKKQVRQPTARDLAENEYRKAIALMHQGRIAEAQEGYEAALNLYPGYHAARQALVGVLVETKKLTEAERVLQDGFALAPAQIGFAMALARLQVDRGDAAQAAATLRKGLDYAQGSPDYIAFFAALLQRQGRHEEAIEQFQAALRIKPASGVWWLGLGISLQSANRAADAQDAFRRARATNNLSPELAAFADQRIRQLQ